MTLDETIEMYTSNAEYERQYGNLQGWFNFRQLADWLKDYKRLLEQEPCDIAVSYDSVMQILYDYDCINENALMVKAIKELPHVTQKSDVLNKIRAEIEQMRGKDEGKWKIDGTYLNIDYVLEVIDKYGGEQNER